MVFIIQNTQNRDKGARTSMVNLESLSEEELDKLQKQFEALQHARENDNDSGDGERTERVRASALP